MPLNAPRNHDGPNKLVFSPIEPEEIFKIKAPNIFLSPLTPAILPHVSLRPPGVLLVQQFRSVQVFPAGGEHGHQRVLLCRRLFPLPVPGSLSVDEGPAAVPQPLPAGQAQVPVNYITQGALQRQRPLQVQCEAPLLNKPKSAHTTLKCLPKCLAELWRIDVLCLLKD